MEPTQSYLVMASHLPTKRLSSTLQFFRAVSAIRKQLANTEGLIGYTLRANPLARNYWTLSVWTGETSLDEFMRTAPHSEVMSSLQPIMGPTKFVRWEIGGAEGRPSWSTALERLRSP
jgi:quinol monooxygenase YgiN